LCDFAEEIGFERLGVFAYSEQEGTRAATYPDDVPDEVKRARQEELTEIQRAISSERLARYVGKTTEVLVDQVADPAAGGATHVGRVMWQADDVDGVTYLARGGWARPGDFVTATVVDSDDDDFHAAALA
jgi:tRNA A37 methylthiotransferase MiaB